VLRAIDVALQTAYRAGWRDATAAAKAAASGKQPKGRATDVRALAADLKAPTSREIVLQALEAKPGLEAIEVIEWAQAKGFPVSSDSVRQAISRLGKKGRVIRFGVGYALKGAKKKGPGE
jgi:SOS response regulatory protein OraA/RecX